MGVIEISYFCAFALCIALWVLSKKPRLNWVLILIILALHAAYFFGWPGIFFLLSVAIISTAAELVSLTTPFNIFGVSYRYDLSHEYFRSRIVLGKVYPIEITAAWMLFKYVSFFLACIVLSPLGVPAFARVVIGALVLVSFDLMLDPYAVANGAWRWQRGGIFFGIPWRNFLGWFIVGLATSLPFMYLQPRTAHEPWMILTAFLVCALTPLMTSGKLLSLDIRKAMLAMTPLTLFVLFGLWVIFS